MLFFLLKMFVFDNKLPDSSCLAMTKNPKKIRTRKSTKINPHSPENPAGRKL
jgi:hypothetical protein